MIKLTKFGHIFTLWSEFCRHGSKCKSLNNFKKINHGKIFKNKCAWPKKAYKNWPKISKPKRLEKEPESGKSQEPILGRQHYTMCITNGSNGVGWRWLMNERTVWLPEKSLVLLVMTWRWLIAGKINVSGVISLVILH